MTDSAATCPILVVWDSRTPHRLSGYITEILDVEGYNWHTVHDLASGPLTPEVLSRHQIAILAHVEPSTEVQDVLLEHVREGGNLVALRPPREMAAKLGLGSSFAERTMVDRYIELNGNCAVNVGVEPYVLQFHGRAEQYTWADNPSAVMAHLAADRDYVTENPAIVIDSYGEGQWAVFTYDLAESTVLFHQGLREQASTGVRPDPGGEYQYKTNDLFVGYLDPELGHLPQADLHQDALGRILDWMASLSRPLPRLWHFPDGSPALAMFTGDSDGMSMDDFANTIATADRFGIPYTTYLKIEHHEDVTPELQTALEARGHDFGEHPYAGAQPSLEEMREGLREELGAFRKRYGRSPVTNRSHSVIWVGWTESAKYLRENGVRLDTNFTAGRFHRTAYLNGSGLPVKFMDENGELLDIYEQCTTLSDDGYVGVKILAQALTIDECIAFTRRRLDDAAERFHSVYNPCFHPLRTRPGAESNQRWYEAAIQACIDRGFHFASARGWLAFNDGRRSLRITEYSFDQESLTLDLCLEAAMDVSGVALALPYTFRGSPMSSAAMDGEAADTAPKRREGRMQVMLPADYDAGRPRHWRIRWSVG